MSAYGVETVNSIEPITRTGLTFDKVEPNRLVASMPFAANANHAGILYAGSLFTLAEVAAGVLFMNRYDSSVIAPICAGMDIRFRRPATGTPVAASNTRDTTLDGKSRPRDFAARRLAVRNPLPAARPRLAGSGCVAVARCAFARWRVERAG